MLFSPVPPSSDGFSLHSITVYSTHRSTEPFHPARVTQMTRERERQGGEEWPNVFVPGPNEASDAMNSLFDGSTTVSWWCVTWERLPLAGNHSASHHLLIFFPLSFLLFFQATAYSLFFFPLLQEHIFKLMKSDSYARFLRSNIYQDLLLARKKVSCTLWPPQHWFFFPHRTTKLSVVVSDQGGLLLKLITDEECKAVGLGYFVRSTIDQTCA